MVIQEMMCNFRQNPIGIGNLALLTWNYEVSYERDMVQTAFCVDVALDFDFHEIVYSSGAVLSSEMQFALNSFFTLSSGCIYYWRVTATDSEGVAAVSPTASFETALLDEKLWDTFGSYWIVCGDAEKADDPAAPVFYTETEKLKNEQNGRIVSARAYVYTFGFSYLKINGFNCSHRLLSPPNTVYDRRCLYETYDITSYLDSDDTNLFEIYVGGGYGETYSQWGYRFFGRLGARAIFLITYENGEIARLSTDENWYFRSSAVQYCDLYNGETCNTAISEYVTGSVKADNSIAPKGILTPNTMPHIRAYDYIKPVSQRKTAEGIIYDFGVNIAGFCEISVEAPRGTQITLLHSELIAPEGSYTTWTNREAKATDTYICSGFGVERWQPAFTYHGFRYVRVSGLESVKSFSIVAYAICADVRETGHFYCSDPVINRIHENSRRSIRANFVSIPTDCPVRDERTPCQMDSQAMEEAAIYNFDVHSYYSKWLLDILGGHGNPDWNGDSVYLVWRLYHYYGDIGLVERCYGQLDAYVKSLAEKSRENGYIWAQGFGDWCSPNENTWESFFSAVTSVNTSLFYSMAKKMAQFAALFHNARDVEFYNVLAGQIAENFLKKLVDENGVIGSGRQTEYLMPLYFGLADHDPVIKQKLFENLMKKIAADGHIDTGIYGTMAFLDVLCEFGEKDTAYQVLTGDAYPGFVAQIAMGATSLWEQWAYKGGMHSHSHGFFSSIDASFYKYYGGVTPLEIGYAKFRIRPVLPSGMQFAHVKMNTPAGQLKVKTEFLSCGTEMALTIPPNTRAKVYIPVPRGAGCFKIFDGELQLDESEFMFEKDYISKEVGSGIYRFRLVRNLRDDFYR